MTAVTAYDDGRVSVHLGDCLDVLRSLPDDSVDAVVTDPPYGLEFMGKEWDAPWQRGDDVNTDAGLGAYELADGYTRLPKPSFTGSSNPKCFNCKGTRRGRRDGTADRAVCLCEDGGRFPNTRAIEMRAFQQWCEQWATECLRVLKPGGHMLAFGGTRTWHRLACAVEDAGFEVRDSIAWLYGSGFSKSWNFKTMYKGEWCSCATANALPYNHADNTDLPRVRGDVHPPTVTRSEGQDGLLLASVQRRSEGSGVGEARPQGPSSMEPGDGSPSGRVDDGREEPGVAGRLVHRAGQGLPNGAPTGSPEGARERLRGRAPASDGVADRAASDAARGGASHQRRPGRQSAGEPEALPGSHESLDDGALRDGAVCPRCGGLDPFYQGAGTGLKPAFEPVVVARKPLSGTVAQTVLAHGTGALNIDACRIEHRDAADLATSQAKNPGRSDTVTSGVYGAGRPQQSVNTSGRWPANVVLDESQAAALDEQSGERTSGTHAPHHRRNAPGGNGETHGAMPGVTGASFEDKGGASRFFKVAEADPCACQPCPGRGNDGHGMTHCAECCFGSGIEADMDCPRHGIPARFTYVAKAPKRERPRSEDGASHPTVKPLDLMRWLVRLVTPPGGLVLDPFAGSGTTVEACIVEGFRCIAIEREPDYLPLILQRIHRRRDPVAAIRQTGDDLGLFELDGEPA